MYKTIINLWLIKMIAWGDISVRKRRNLWLDNPWGSSFLIQHFWERHKIHYLQGLKTQTLPYSYTICLYRFTNKNIRHMTQAYTFFLKVCHVEYNLRLINNIQSNMKYFLASKRMWWWISLVSRLSKGFILFPGRI